MEFAIIGGMGSLQPSGGSKHENTGFYIASEV